MKVANRSAVTVRRRHAYVEWARRTPPEQVYISVDDLARVRTVYLVRRRDRVLDDEEVVSKDELAGIFAAELNVWTSDKPRDGRSSARTWWPRTGSNLEYSELVGDLGPGRLATEGS